MPLDRPIPAFYCCYLLRSTVSKASVYVGSTPNPVRRLRQHNGLAKGGAVRTSRQNLRPWEMTAIVTGFPSHIAALQFEWAWQNPHITLHIPPTSRIQHATSKKRSGHPKRPRHSVSSLLSNLHLLLRVPSFARWPLELRFFSRDVHRSWLKWCRETKPVLRESIVISTDFPPEVASSSDEDQEKEHGLEALRVDYTDIKPQISKAKEIVDFEREGSCSLCDTELAHSAGIYAICPHPGCESVTHLSCLSKEFLKGEKGALVPIQGTCPGCKKETRWVDVVREASLRMRGQKEVEKLLRVKRRGKGKGFDASQVIDVDEDEDRQWDVDDEMELDEEVFLRDLNRSKVGDGDGWNAIDDDDDSDTGSITSTASTSQMRRDGAYKAKTATGLDTVIEDSDWDDVEVLD